MSDRADADPRFFHAVRRDGGCTTHGLHACELGEVVTHPDGPDGAHARWRWDGATLVVETSWNGFFPIFWAADEREVVVGTSPLAVLARGVSPAVDDEAVAAFLRLGFFVGEDTPFRHVRALPPGGTLTWSAGRWSVQGGGMPALRERAMGRDDAIDAFNAAVRDAVRRRLPDEGALAVPLSGGRDSRHLLLELDHLGRRPDFCVTMRPMPPQNEADVEVARQLASRLGIEHQVVDQRPSALATERRKNRLTGLLTEEHAWAVAMSDHLAGRARTIFDGIAGDVLSAGLYQTAAHHALARAGRLDELTEQLYSSGIGHQLLGRGARPALARDAALHRIRRELAKHAEAPNPLGSFYFWNRTRREIALIPFRILERSVASRAPFLDRGVHALCASLPAELFFDRTFHTEAIARAYPRFADVPYESKGTSTAQSAFLRRYARDCALMLLRERPRAVRAGFALPRLARAMVDRRYGASMQWLAPFLVWLAQVEREAGADLAAAVREQQGLPALAVADA